MTLPQVTELLGSMNAQKLSVTALLVLSKLRNGERLLMSYAAKLAGVTPASMTGTVDRLERLALLRRVLDPADRRVTELEITDQGRALVDRLLSLEGRVA